MQALLFLIFIKGFNGLEANPQNYSDPTCYGDRQAIVHLFEWKWDWIAEECEKVLGPAGFCGVQVSPPMEHVQGSQWWIRYQPVSYKLNSRSGNRKQFRSMVQRCNAAGVIIIVDAVINHMTSHQSSGSGTGGSTFDGQAQTYDGVPYSSEDFHQPYCEIQNYGDPSQVRDCYLVSLNDLDGGRQYVRDKISAYFNDLVEMGVRGFRVDASKYMWPGDLQAIQDMTRDVDGGGRPFFFHEVIDMGGEAISANEYTGIGKVTEFRYGLKMAQCINKDDFDCLADIYDEDWGMLDGEHAVVFVDNHDNQRGTCGNGLILTASRPYDNDWKYKVASAFMLGHNYGFKRVMSSYYFTDSDEGPPSSAPAPYPDVCGNGWTCEHRWTSILNMAKFSNAVAGLPVTNWQASGSSLGFGRGSVGFLALGDLGKEFQTGLPDGVYCDIIRDCGQNITVSGGRGYFQSPDDHPVVAICTGC